ncbi:CRISPR-associated endonuclease Cas1 [Benzoatithermus flavus]|uniref:CRISPR-associated endonuclease Cas1 n=1 Tax=Benzoatithermus flavus TaxID=3108223 RepID=A0ABU8XY29_9PROT
MIPLYVDGSAAPVRIVLDGPSLRLEQAGISDARWPLQRVTRLVVRGAVAWGDGALAACLGRGIPVSLLDGSGRTVGTCLPARARPSDTAQLLDEACAVGRLEEAYGNWRRAAERRAVLDLVRSLGLRPRDLRPASVRRALLAALDRLGAAWPGEMLLARLEALLDAELCRLLLEEGIGARFQSGDAEALVDLRRDLAGLLGWDLGRLAWRLAAYLARHGGKHRTELDVARRIARQFEAGREQRATATVRYLADLRRCLREFLP